MRPGPTCSKSASLVVCADLRTMDPTQFATPSTRPWSDATFENSASACDVRVKEFKVEVELEGSRPPRVRGAAGGRRRGAPGGGRARAGPRGADVQPRRMVRNGAKAQTLPGSKAPKAGHAARLHPASLLPPNKRPTRLLGIQGVRHQRHGVAAHRRRERVEAPGVAAGEHDRRAGLRGKALGEAAADAAAGAEDYVNWRCCLSV